MIDQFEELFTQTERDEQQQFIEVIQTLRTVDTCTLILVIRADFYPDLMNSHLWPIDASQRLEIAPLRGDALRQAIEHPAADVGVHLEPELVERLLADAADEPGILPLLQETMVLLWSEMQRRLVPLSAYKQLGSDGRKGLAVAMATKADATQSELSTDQQSIARRIFLRLIQFGEGRADTRRQQPVEALRSDGEDSALFDRTLKQLTDSRLLTLSGEETGSEQDEADIGRKVDIAHEALISGWPKLRKWLTEYQEAEQTRRRLHDKVKEWILFERKDGFLGKVELLEAERWLKSPYAEILGKEELPALVQKSREVIDEAEREKEAARQRELQQAQELVEKEEARRKAEEEARHVAEESAVEQTKSAGRLRRLAIGLAVVFLLAVGVAVFAWLQQQAAETARQKAEQSEKETKRQLARNYWSNGINARDTENDPLKASHYFMKASELADSGGDLAFSRNAQLAGDMLVRSIHLGAILEHDGDVNGAVFSQDETRILT